MPLPPPAPPPPLRSSNAPRRIQQLEDDLSELVRKRGLIGGRVAWKRNRAGEYVVALIVPADLVGDSMRALEVSSESERERKRQAQRR